ncbi:MAG: molybdopterin molybdenumtransferase MoeA [Aquificota bacterium]|nr:MAG: molybdopterin molybdenumtransferase MoeA [Aquificota bacterium]
MIPYEEALELVLKSVEPLGIQRLFIWDAVGYVLAEDVSSDTDKPLFDNSAMDGYALRSEDLREVPARLRLVGEVPAGGVFEGRVEKGTAVKIFTGAPIPEGADTVVPVEFTKQEGQYVIVEKAFPQGANIRKKGEEVKKGEKLLKRGTLIRGYEVGVLAWVNKVFVDVYRKPRIGLLTTGDEVVDLGQPLEKPSHIRSTNNHSLYGRAKELGCCVDFLGIVEDEPKRLRSYLERVEEYDLFISTGGVSAGEKDFITYLVKELGFEVVFHKVRIKPAKPVLFAKRGKSLFFGLPGNPVSCIIAFDLLVYPALLKMQGVQECKPKSLRARLVKSFSRRDAERREFVRAKVWFEGEELLCDFSTKTQSHMLSSYVDANCYMVVYEGVREIKEGERVEVIPFPTGITL